MIIDSSVPLNKNTPIYPGEPATNTEQERALTKDGYNDQHAPQIPIKQLPFFAEIDKCDEWYGLLPTLINQQYRWIVAYKDKINIPDEVISYLGYAIKLFEQSIIVTANTSPYNNYAYFAVHPLRAALERIALVYSCRDVSGINPVGILDRLNNDSRKTRTSATEEIMDFANENLPGFRVMYDDMLSRYFGHISNLDKFRVDERLEKDTLFSSRTRVLPLVIIVEVGNIIVSAMSELLEEQGHKHEEPQVGVKGELLCSVKKYIRLASLVLSEKHSRNKPLSIRIKMYNLKDIRGDIVVNELYRGGMEIVRIGEQKDKPSPQKLAELKIFAIGRTNADNVTVKTLSESDTGEKYELSWPKHIEVDSFFIGIMASHLQQEVDELGDFLSDYIKTWTKKTSYQ